MPRRKADARRLPYISYNVRVETSRSYDDAVSGGGLGVRMEVQVEPINHFEEAFRALSKEEEETIRSHFSGDESNILVSHKESNISISGKILRCLKPREWLNDEVINLYMTLLKERECREPKKHLKCHFFNTFFYPKLVQSGSEYNYEAVRKWTLRQKLGYHLRDCDKIFVPITMDLHWSLVVINVKEQTIQYLDSLKGYHSCEYMDVMARYLMDEVKDKNKVHIDVSRWRKYLVQNLPFQSNVFDCGMFMIKYIDFYSRGMDLCFHTRRNAIFPA